MYNKRYLLFLFLIIFIIGAISSVSASDVIMADGDLSSYDNSIIYEGINERMDSTIDNSNSSGNAFDKNSLGTNNYNNHNQDILDTCDFNGDISENLNDNSNFDNSLDEESIGDSIASNDKSNFRSDSVNDNVIYFDASAASDGDGSEKNPYKFLYPDRITPGLTVYFRDGSYQLNGTCILDGVKFIGSGNSKINSIVSNQYDIIIIENSSVQISNLYFTNVNVLSHGNLNMKYVVFDGNDLFVSTDEISSGLFYNSYGGVIVCDSPANVKTNLTLEGCIFEKVYDAFNGGIIAAVNSDISISSTIFRDYSATYKGGAIYCLNSNLNISRSTFLPYTISEEDDFSVNRFNRYTSYYGGSIFCENSNVTLYLSKFNGSVSYSFGGCLASLNSKMDIRECDFNNSMSLTDGGGAIYNAKGELIIFNSNFNNNSAEFGGAICNLNSILDSYHSIYDKNAAIYYGGTIYDIYGTLRLNTNFFYSSSALIGGAIYTRIPNDFNLYENYFGGTFTKEGASIFFDGKKENIYSDFFTGENSNYGELIVPLNSTGLDLYNSYANDYHVFVEFTATLKGEDYSIISNPLFYQVSSKNSSYLHYPWPTYYVSDGLVRMMIWDADDLDRLTSVACNNVLRNVSANIVFSDEFSNPKLTFYLCRSINSNLYNFYGTDSSNLFSGSIDDLNLDQCLIQKHSIDLSSKIMEGNFNVTEYSPIDFANPFLNIKYDNLYDVSVFSPVSLVNFSINSSSYYSSNPSPSNPDVPKELTSYFNSGDSGSLTMVKNQGKGGNCWAFAGLATLEACLKKATGVTFDFSEENAKNLMAAYSVFGLKLETNYGGYDSMLMGYLASWLGPVDESIESYDEYSSISLQADPMFHIQNIKFLPARINTSDNDLFKEAIRDNGAVSVTIKWGKDYHAVSLVGWDDDFEGYDSLGNYANGAWIFKNSWGDSWGYDGFGYLSYEAKLSEELYPYMHAYTFIFTDTNPYTRIYQYDFAGVSEFYPISGTVYYKNVFIADDDSLLSAFSTYFDRDTNFTVMVYKGNELILSQEGFSSAGYYTVPFFEFVPLAKGEEFSIVVKNHNEGENCIPVCLAEEITKKTFSENVSFISYDGVNWFDLHDYADDCQVACIKAFTQNINLTHIRINVTNFSSVKTRNLNIKVDFDDFNAISSINFCLVKFIINGKIYYAQIKDGKAVLNVNLEEGLNSLSVQYKDNLFESNVVVFNFTVSSDSNNQSFNALQDIIDNAAPNSTINLNKDYFYEDIFDNGDLGIVIDKPLTINGNGHVIDGLSMATGLFINSNGVVLNNITIKNAVSVNGAAIYVSARNVKLNFCNFINNKASNFGGAVYSLFDISINDCNFSNNNATVAGALYLNNFETSTIRNSIFNNNYASRDGSAVYLIGSGTGIFSSSSFNNNFALNNGAIVSGVNCNNFTGCSFSNNYARSGAAVFSTAHLNEFNRCRFSNNSALISGGAISSHNTLNVFDSVFINNSVTEKILDSLSFGGAAILSYDTLNVHNSNFTDNHADLSNGGAIYAIKYLNIYRSRFINNHASNGGGAVYGTSSQFIRSSGGSYWSSFKFYEGYFYDSIFINNSANVGGAIEDAELVKNCTFINNSANYAGAIDGAKVVNASDFIKNYANFSGGSIYSSYGNFSVVNSSFVNGSAVYGGAIYSQSNINVSSSKFIGNSAKEYGGAIFSKGNLSISHSNLVNNYASYGGSIISFLNNDISFCNFTDNHVNVSGGAVYSAGNLSISHSRFTKNSANFGGAVFVHGNDSEPLPILNIFSCSFDRNIVNKSGGAVYSEGNTTVNGSSFDLNSAKWGSAFYSVGSLNMTDSNIKSEGNVYSIFFTYYHDDEDNPYGHLYMKNNRMDTKYTAINYNSDEKAYNLTVYLVISNITAIRGQSLSLCYLMDEDGNTFYSYDSENLTLSLTNQNNNVIKCNIKYNITLGCFVLDTSSIDVGIYKVTGNFADGYKNQFVSKTGKLTIIDRSIIKSSGLTKVYGKNNKLVIILKDSKGNAISNVYISISINGKTVKLKTNSNGQVSMAVNMAPGTYLATFRFAGNNYYSSVSNTAPVIIKKAAVKITASKKTFKLRNKSKSYSVILKNNLGKAMKKTKVKLIVNGRTYTAKTNSKGKAIFKLSKLTKKGSFKVVIKYAGNKNYKAASKKVTIKVKK